VKYSIVDKTCARVDGFEFRTVDAICAKRNLRFHEPVAQNAPLALNRSRPLPIYCDLSKRVSTYSEKSAEFNTLNEAGLKVRRPRSL
jgi:hypothetical protein